MKQPIPMGSREYPNRGALKNTKNSIRVSFNLDWNTWKDFKLAAGSEGLCVGGLLRKIVEKYLEE